MLRGLMAVPLLDLTRQYQHLQHDLEAAVLGVMRSCRFIHGPEVEGLERELAAYLGCKDVVGLSSGTDALLAPLMALGVGKGDEVLVPVYSFFATAGVVSRLGATPVFVDVEPRFHNLDPVALKAALERHPKAKAVIVVHLFGAPADMPAIRAVVDPRGIPIIEDCAQAIGTRRNGRHVGADGLCSAWSTFPSKNLGGAGDGGFLGTDDVEFGKRIRQLRNHGQSELYFDQTVGGNFRLDALQAAVLRVKLKHVDAFNERRRANAAKYRALVAEAGIEKFVQLPEDVADRHTYHQFVTHLRGVDRDTVKQHLTERGVGCAVYYPLPFHLQPCFADLGWRKGEFPVAEAASKTNLALPIFPELTDAEIHEVVRVLAEAVRGK